MCYLRNLYREEECHFDEMSYLLLRDSPNCVATAIDVKGARHIFLIAARQLAPGEELT